MYLPLARKYRPKNFDEIIGQEHVTTTLKNAISMGKVASAFLFTGPRGIGKTSTARVLAKGLNCQNGPTQNPCSKCTPCQEISKGINLDVLEIDGASNRGIDEIRNLRENIKLKPASSRFRIYIIDEVHMLTQEAFNALLKTLEEPPEHVKFIFATTRSYKVLPTVISRCQRFDFRAIPISVIVDKLKEIVREENLNIEEDALFLIAKNADGSLRDAEMLLDQMLTFTKGKIKGSDVSKIFGTLEQDVFVKITEALLSHDGANLIKIIDELVNYGKEPMLIATALLEHFRNLLVISICKDSYHVSVSEEDKSALEALSKRFTPEELFYIVYTLSNAIDMIGKTALGKIPLEISLLKLSRKEKMLPVAEIIKKIDVLEALLQGGGKQIADTRSSDSGQRATDNGQRATSNEQRTSSNEQRASSIEDRTSGPTEPSELYQRITSVWPEVIRGVKTQKMSAGSYLEEGQLLEPRNHTVIVGFSKPNTLHREALEVNNNKKIIKDVLKNILDMDLNIEFISLQLVEKKAQESQEDLKLTEKDFVMPIAKKVEPIIKSAVDIFDGRIIRESESR